MLCCTARKFWHALCFLVFPKKSLSLSWNTRLAWSEWSSEGHLGMFASPVRLLLLSQGVARRRCLVWHANGWLSGYRTIGNIDLLLRRKKGKEGDAEMERGNHTSWEGRTYRTVKWCLHNLRDFRWNQNKIKVSILLMLPSTFRRNWLCTSWSNRPGCVLFFLIRTHCLLEKRGSILSRLKV